MSTKNIIVLGSGMVGRAIASDLSTNHNISIIDLDEINLSKISDIDIRKIKLDITSGNLEKFINPFDLVVCAVPGFLGFNTLKRIIEAGKDVVDISFFPEDSLKLNDLAIKHNVTAIVDCGVAPGMDNLILGRYNEILNITDFECLVGGLPKIKKWPFNYKAPFSPIDVIEEYTRPARYVENKRLIIRDALTDCTLHEFEKVGTLESFNSDGLRTIIDTMPHIENMKEKTLRYPGHSEYVKVLKETGFFNTENLEFTSKILFNEWKLGEKEEELTVMRVTIKGENKNGDIEEVVYSLYDEYNKDTNTSSMARTTGYTATSISNLLLDSKFSKKGIFPLELIGKYEECYDYIMEYLKERGINYNISKNQLSDK